MVKASIITVTYRVTHPSLMVEAPISVTYSHTPIVEGEGFSHTPWLTVKVSITVCDLKGHTSLMSCSWIIIVVAKTATAVAVSPSHSSTVLGSPHCLFYTWNHRAAVTLRCTAEEKKKEKKIFFFILQKSIHIITSTRRQFAALFLT